MAKFEQEDASKLQFPREYHNLNFLTNAEVALELQKATQKAAEKDEYVPEVIATTLATCEKFSGFQDSSFVQATVTALKNELATKTFQQISEEGDVISRSLHRFEVVALINLDPENYDEAVALIPSLGQRFSEKEVEELLAIMAMGKAKN